MYDEVRKYKCREIFSAESFFNSTSILTTLKILNAFSNAPTVFLLAMAYGTQLFGVVNHNFGLDKASDVDTTLIAGFYGAPC